MMMSKPAPSTTESSNTARTTTLQPPAPLKKTPEDAVQDLERRLAVLSASTPTTTEAGAAPTPAVKQTTPQPVTQTAAPAAKSGGKNALLARIMAAQERAKQAQGAAPTAPTTTMKPKEQDPPPPAFDESLLPTQTPAPPPAFDASVLPPPQKEQTQAPSTMIWDPHAPTVPPPTTATAPPPPIESLMAPSAPAFEDLMDHSATAPPPPAADQMTNVIMPPPLEAPTESTQTVSEQPDDAVAALMGMDLSDEERKALLEEQAKILAGIEAERKQNVKSAADAAADQFEQRSFAAAVGANNSTTTASSSRGVVNLGSGQQVALHGQERTRQAIADGTALLLQCLSCNNWMQVTESATLMFCPVCQTVSPVSKEGADVSEGTAAAAAAVDEVARQLKADQDLAEQLQKEEYKRAEASDAATRMATRTGTTSRSPPRQQAASSSSGQSWMEWLGFATPAPAPPTASSPSMSFARPPDSRTTPTRPLPSPSYENTTISRSSSREEGESNSLLPAGRVAERQPLFSCVADSISTAATSLSTALQGQDAEGNVHGVDASSLLVMSNAGRERDDGDNKSTPYSMHQG